MTEPASLIENWIYPGVTLLSGSDTLASQLVTQMVNCFLQGEDWREFKMDLQSITFLQDALGLIDPSRYKDERELVVYFEDLDPDHSLDTFVGQVSLALKEAKTDCAVMIVCDQAKVNSASMALATSVIRVEENPEAGNTFQQIKNRVAPLRGEPQAPLQI